ncbi:MAG: transcription antitermination factor NusB [Clostridia bacterium]|nr:transcription antitermination factor NusB [Clostridia bacterium]
MNRHTSRENAYLMIFEYGYGKYDSLEEMQTLALEERGLMLDDFGRALLEGVANNITEIDSVISANSSNWSSSRISKAALAALRLAVYEIKYTDISNAVAINEAVELTKKYDMPEAASFVNGILGAVAK